MIILGLTGGIATGKSTVSKRLREHHKLTIVDADVIARQVVEPGTPAYKAIINHFGASVTLPDGKGLDRPALGRLVFGNEPNRQFLNSVVHPAVRREMLRQVALAYMRGCDIVVLDVPLLYESKLDRFCSSSVVVSCAEDTQLTRLLARDPHLSEDDARKRIASQMSMSEKEARAQHVIDNNGTLEELYDQIDALINKVRPNIIVNYAEWLGPPVATGLLAAAIYWFNVSRSKL
ncbi:uncharacterized protein SAPINGB_P000836 [Magnusiomyces paraingens]|uniref:Dephospho-CoA kinase n=1 Tax=Magnusiomyces paraingens TaxID=2606893 RepID=A0A5E8B8T4_9ASCO|nr:uncharacterized protein SAPINGB_P000836 [Saprochaete ingens]VVT45678.1 unnamed protein product [Saprochaete ingens]